MIDNKAAIGIINLYYSASEKADNKLESLTLILEDTTYTIRCLKQNNIKISHTNISISEEQYEVKNSINDNLIIIHAVNDNDEVTIKNITTTIIVNSH